MRALRHGWRWAGREYTRVLKLEGALSQIVSVESLFSMHDFETLKMRKSRPSRFVYVSSLSQARVRVDHHCGKTSSTH